jgi:hypothetical protein
MDIATLRVTLHQAVDATLDRVAQSNKTSSQPSAVVLEDPHAGPFTFKWPSQGDYEKYHKSSIYRIPGGADRIRLGWTKRRQAYGGTPERVVAFRESESGQLYPLTEFVETDDGRFSADILNPHRPKTRLKDGDPIPSEYKTANVARRDALYGSVANGPTMRYVVSRNDEAAMATHALRVGQLRGHL